MVRGAAVVLTLAYLAEGWDDALRVFVFSQHTTVKASRKNE